MERFVKTMSFGEGISIFSTSMLGLYSCRTNVLDAARAGIDSEFEKLKLIQKELEAFDKKNGKLSFEEKEKFVDLFLRSQKQNRSVHTRIVAYEQMGRNFIVNAVSNYEHLLVNVLREILTRFPSVLETSDKPYKVSEIIAHTSFEKFREQIIGDVCDQVIQSGYIKRLEWIDKKTKTNLFETLPDISAFIEVNERRHVFVHHQGMVSEKYLDICKEYAAKENIKAGYQLRFEKIYFLHIFDLLYQHGVISAQLVWRKICPDETNEADKIINELGLNLINDKNYSLAIKIFEFVLNVKPFKSITTYKYFFILNLAQCHRWSGNIQKSKEILGAEDWTGLEDKIMLGYYILNDNFEKASTYVVKLKNDEQFSTAYYVQWPIFQEFIKSSLFQDAFKSAYGIDFQKNLSTDVASQEIVNYPPKAE